MNLKTEQNNDFRTLFYSSLPNKPYCSDNLDRGVFIRTRKIAIEKPYIQPNPPFMINSLTFDVDQPDAFFAWSDANLAPPNWISKNRTNGHAHIGYLLAAPVCRTYKARDKVLRYLARIEQAYTEALQADKGYVGLISKNPYHERWDNYVLNEKPYELNYLADFVNLPILPTAPEDTTGLGRNCLLFDIVRFWAYRAVREYSFRSVDTWYTDVLKEAVGVNYTFPSPLPYSEVKATAKSIARWVWANQEEAYFNFIAKQTARGRQGGLKGNSSPGGKARSQQYSDLRDEALKLHILGMKQVDIAKQLEVSDRTIRTWLKNRKVQA